MTRFSTLCSSWRLMLLGLWMCTWSATSSGDTAAPNGTEPVDVTVYLWVLDVIAVDSVRQTFTANVFMELNWQDDSLRHEGPEARSARIDSIWHPEAQVFNALSFQETLDQNVVIQPDGQVQYGQRILGEFSQYFALKEFPFDTQALKIVLVSSRVNPDQVRWNISTDSGMEQHITIPDWSLRDWRTRVESVQEGNFPDYEQAVFEIELRRDRGFFLVKVLLPLTLIVMMSWTVFWINPAHAAPQLSISATAMLTLIAFRFQMSSMLPQMSTLSRLDWFVLFSTFLVFLALLQAVWTTGLASKGQLSQAQRIDRISRWAFPTLFVASLAVSFF